MTKHPPLGSYGPNNEGLPDVSHGFHIFADGNVWCAVGPDFIDLVKSRAGFGYTPEDAYADWWYANQNTVFWQTNAKPDFDKFVIHQPTVKPNGQ